MASELLNTPRRVRKTYPKHFLNSVHCEIGFIGTSLDSILSTEKSLKLFFESKGFEISRQVFTKEVFMESSLNKAATIISKETPIGLMFSSQKPRIEIQVLDTKVIISNFDYVGFEQFNSQLKEICVGISNFIPRKEVKKVGLRKISSIII